MADNEENMKNALRVIVDGGSLDHAPVRGGLVLMDKDGSEIRGKRITMTTFLELQRNEYIVTGTNQPILYNHPVFRPSLTNRVFRYEITPQGREFLMGRKA